MVFYYRTTTIPPMKSYTHCVQPANVDGKHPTQEKWWWLGDGWWHWVYNIIPYEFDQFLPNMAPEPEHFIPKSAPEPKIVDPCFDISPKSPEIESALLHAIFITAPTQTEEL